jgi:LysM repeat protein
MRHRSPARWLAPLALVTCAVAVYAVAQGGSSSGGATTRSSTSNRTSRGTATGTSVKRPATRKAKFYVVKSGDVLSAIAEKTGVTVAEIQRLNPSVDAAALHVGQKLRLGR